VVVAQAALVFRRRRPEVLVAVVCVTLLVEQAVLQAKEMPAGIRLAAPEAVVVAHLQMAQIVVV
jgi:hypothetical protein